MHRDEKMNPRTCIVCRQEKTTDDMIRFVLDPDGNVVPDLKRNLPGRGVWVSANRACVDEAVRKCLFNRGFLQPVKAGEELGSLIDKLLFQNSLSAVSMAKKAGLVVNGKAKVEKAIAGGKIVLLIHASDAAADGVEKLERMVKGLQLDTENSVEICNLWTGEQLDKALGGSNMVHLAVEGGNAADHLIASIRCLLQYRIATLD